MPNCVSVVKAVLVSDITIKMCCFDVFSPTEAFRELDKDGSGIAELNVCEVG